jgi:hypothetical protein
VVNTYGNHSIWPTFSGLKPDANGKITLQVNLIAGERAPLNVMDLAIYNVGGAGGVGSAGPAGMAFGSPAIGSSGTAAAASAVTPTKTLPVKTDNVGTAAGQSVQTKTFTAQINFQPASVSAPEGYLIDSGLPFGAKTNGYRYGWTTDVSSFAVQRNNAASPDIRYDTAIMLTSGGTWEMAVPNGMYDVRIVAGAGGNLSTQKFSVEGVPMTQATTTATTGWFEETVTVVVTDGKLTLVGSSGSSICFVRITGR